MRNNKRVPEDLNPDNWGELKTDSLYQTSKIDRLHWHMRKNSPTTGSKNL
jgi:hypothetical protein